MHIFDVLLTLCFIIGSAPIGSVDGQWIIGFDVV